MHDLAGISLDLDVSSLTARGRKATPLVVQLVRPLEGSDLVLLASNRGTAPVSVKKLSQRHHGLARSLAMGVSPGDAAIIHGYDPSRVSILQGDPAFEDLVSFYQNKVDTKFEDVAEHLAGLSRDVLSELQTRLEDTPEDFTVKELQGLLDSMLDRTGHGKQATQLNVTADISERLNEARKRELQRRKDEAMQTIEGVAKDVTGLAAE